MNKIYTKDIFESIYEIWSRKNPSYEKHYDNDIIKVLSDFSKGTNETSDAKGKILGAGYEVLIMAYFIGLYSNKKKPFGEFNDIKDLGQRIEFWGNIDSKKGRKAYPRLREYIFISLVAKTPDINWIELDKGNLTPNEVANLLMDTMEQYINYGLSFILEKMKDDEGYFYRKDSFLDIFKGLTRKKTSPSTADDDIPDSLD